MEKYTDRKPVVTCHGEPELFSSIQAELLQSLQREPMEWRRSYGRAPKVVFVDVNFETFNADSLPKENDRHLLQKPFFHTYWTDCADADAYKLVVKDEISSWQQMLREHGVQDWMIILVETKNPTRGQKPKLALPRASVADKIKSDFCSRQSDRIIVLYEPQNPVPTQRSIESWQNFLQRLKQLVLVSYNRVLGRFEEMVRGERERRNEKGWEFCRYFLLQEELAFTFETLNQLEDALVQYDELDALFSQFIINSQAGENPEWLTGFSGPCNCWDGLNLTQPIHMIKRRIIEEGKPTLLDIRNYLFSRQCALLNLLQRPYEVAARSQEFMHNCVQELGILEIPMPTGSIACWVFLSCLEVLQMCEQKCDAANMEKYSHFTASLWVYAQSKLRQLGELCGLMPDTSPTSEQLHIVVGLLGGMNQTAEATVRENSPSQKLREALSSSDAFQKHYLELSELAMGTFKHIGRMRSARLIGKDLAKFYIKKGELNKAETFLMDAIRIYEKEGWALPASDTRKQIAECQKLMDNKHKYLKTCCMLAGDPILSEEDRLVYCHQVLQIAQDLATTTNDSQDEDDADPSEGALACVLPLMPMVDVANAQLKPDTGKMGRNDTSEIHLSLYSYLPEALTFEPTTIGLQHFPVGSTAAVINRTEFKRSQSLLGNTGDNQSGKRTGLFGRLLPSNQVIKQSLDLEEEIRHSTQSSGGNLADASLLACRNAQAVLKREDSTTSLGRMQDVVQKEESLVTLEKCDVELKPGLNQLVFEFKPSDNGTYWCKQFAAKLGGVDFILPLSDLGLSIQVLSPEPTLTVCDMSDTNPLLAGIPQDITMSLFTGFYTMKEDDKLSISTPSNIQILDAETEEYNIKSEGSSAMISVGDISPQSVVSIKVPMIAKMLGPEKETFGEGIHTYELEVSCPWNDTVITNITFQQPFKVTHNLHTAVTRKCVQLSVQSLCGMDFIVSDAALVQTSKGSLTITAVHSSQPQTLYNGNTVSFLWVMEVNSNGSSEQSTVGLEFEMKYQAENADRKQTTHQYVHSFTLENYQTQYTIKASVKPPSNQELCRAGSLCTLNLFIQSASSNGTNVTQAGDSNVLTSLMYQVEADANMWALCGRSKGVIAMPTGEEVQEIMLEIMPQTPGNLPVPLVKLCKYLNTEKGEDDEPTHTSDAADLESLPTSNNETDPSVITDTKPSLLQFQPGQIYYKSMATQVLVLPESDVSVVEVQT